MHELAYYFPNDLRLRKLANFKKITEKPGIEGSSPAGNRKAKFRELC